MNWLIALSSCYRATLYSPKQPSVSTKQADLRWSGFSSRVRNSNKSNSVQWLGHWPYLRKPESYYGKRWNVRRYPDPPRGCWIRGTWSYRWCVTFDVYKSALTEESCLSIANSLKVPSLPHGSQLCTEPSRPPEGLSPRCSQWGWRGNLYLLRLELGRPPPPLLEAWLGFLGERVKARSDLIKSRARSAGYRHCRRSWIGHWGLRVRAAFESEAEISGRTQSWGLSYFSGYNKRFSNPILVAAWALWKLTVKAAAIFLLLIEAHLGRPIRRRIACLKTSSSANSFYGQV